MNMKTLLIGMMAASVATVMFAQDHPKPTAATYITADQVQRVMNAVPETTDHSIKIVDVGPYNTGVGVVHRGVTKDKEGVASGLEHHFQTENFVILSGSGTMVTGGTMLNPKEGNPDSMAIKLYNGPTSSGTVNLSDPGVTQRVVHPGDVIVIPPDVFHGWIKIMDHVEYISIRPSERVIPAGYVHPVIANDPDPK